MYNYYETNAERYAAETFSADMSEQYNRFLPLLKEGARNPRLKLEEMWYTEDVTGREGFRWMNIIVKFS